MGIGELLPKLRREYFANKKALFDGWSDIRDAYKILRNYICHDTWNSWTFETGNSPDLWQKIGEVNYFKFGYIRNIDMVLK